MVGRIIRIRGASAFDALLSSVMGTMRSRRQIHSSCISILNSSRMMNTRSSILSLNLRSFCTTEHEKGEKEELAEEINKADAIRRETPYQLLNRIRALEETPQFSDSRTNLFNEQKWFNEFLHDTLSKDDLVEKLRVQEKKNNKSRGESATMYTDNEVLLATESWVKEFIIAMNICPFSTGFRDKTSIHISQSTGLFLLSEWVDIHAQHLSTNKEVVSKLLVLPNRAGYANFVDMIEHLKRSPIMDSLLGGQSIKIAVFHPKAVNPMYLDDDSRNFIWRAPFATIQLTRMKEQKQIIKTWERKNNYQIVPKYDGSKTIERIKGDNDASLKYKSEQKLQFLFDSFLPTRTIVCPAGESFTEKVEKEEIIAGEVKKEI